MGSNAERPRCKNDLPLSSAGPWTSRGCDIARPSEAVAGGDADAPMAAQALKETTDIATRATRTAPSFSLLWSRTKRSIGFILLPRRARARLESISAGRLLLRRLRMRKPFC